jgi:hypothetical protein
LWLAFCGLLRRRGGLGDGDITLAFGCGQLGVTLGDDLVDKPIKFVTGQGLDSLADADQCTRPVLTKSASNFVRLNPTRASTSGSRTNDRFPILLLSANARRKSAMLFESNMHLSGWKKRPTEFANSVVLQAL